MYCSPFQWKREPGLMHNSITEQSEVECGLTNVDQTPAWLHVVTFQIKQRSKTKP